MALIEGGRALICLVGEDVCRILEEPEIFSGIIEGI